MAQARTGRTAGTAGRRTWESTAKQANGIDPHVWTRHSADTCSSAVVNTHTFGLHLDAAAVHVVRCAITAETAEWPCPGPLVATPHPHPGRAARLRVLLLQLLQLVPSAGGEANPQIVRCSGHVAGSAHNAHAHAHAHAPLTHARHRRPRRNAKERPGHARSPSGGEGSPVRRQREHTVAVRCGACGDGAFWDGTIH